MLEHSFRPGHIGALELPNRIVMGSMHLGLEAQPDGQKLAAFYAERARDGAGLIVTGGSAVSRVGAGGRHYSFINEPSDADRLQAAAVAVHAEQGRIALQLFHAGRYASEAFFKRQPVAPSAVPSRFSRSAPRAMTEEEIAETICDFASGARRARELGFDAVEIMGSEGYLLNQFLSPLTNRREDAWGGDFERRTLFPRAVVRAVLAATGKEFPVIYRISATDLMPGSTTDEEMRAFAAILAREGVHALEIGIGWHESSVPTVQFTVAPAAWRQYAGQVKTAVGALPVIAGTRINSLELAEEVLACGQADFVSLARAFLADPHIVSKSRAGRSADVNRCIACNQACIDRSLTDRTVSCMVNPRAGHEWRATRDGSKAAPASFGVIGGGPAGLEGARVLASLGHRVVLYEAQPQLGGQFQLARRVPGKEDFGRTIEYFAGELRRLGVEIRLGQRIDAADIAAMDVHEGVLVASGVTPKRIDLPGIGSACVRSYPEALAEAATSAECIAIIGAGGIGVDAAHLFSERGRRVTLMCRGGIVGQHIGRSTRWVLLKLLQERGVSILTGVTYRGIEGEGVWIRDREGEERLIPARTVVIAAGQERNDPLSEALRRRGRLFRVIGGARDARELDAVRAFREGAAGARALARKAAMAAACRS